MKGFKEFYEDEYLYKKEEEEELDESIVGIATTLGFVTAGLLSAYGAVILIAGYKTLAQNAYRTLKISLKKIFNKDTSISAGDFAKKIRLIEKKPLVKKQEKKLNGLEEKYGEKLQEVYKAISDKDLIVAQAKYKETKLGSNKEVFALLGYYVTKIYGVPPLFNDRGNEPYKMLKVIIGPRAARAISTAAMRAMSKHLDIFSPEEIEISPEDAEDSEEKLQEEEIPLNSKDVTAVSNFLKREKIDRKKAKFINRAMYIHVYEDGEKIGAVRVSSRESAKRIATGLNESKPKPKESDINQKDLDKVITAATEAAKKYNGKLARMKFINRSNGYISIYLRGEKVDEVKVSSKESGRAIQDKLNAEDSEEKLQEETSLNSKDVTAVSNFLKREKIDRKKAKFVNRAMYIHVYEDGEKIGAVRVSSRESATKIATGLNKSKPKPKESDINQKDLDKVIKAATEAAKKHNGKLARMKFISRSNGYVSIYIRGEIVDQVKVSSKESGRAIQDKLNYERN